jgi:hypothetical protein
MYVAKPERHRFHQNDVAHLLQQDYSVKIGGFFYILQNLAAAKWLFDEQPLKGQSHEKVYEFLT